MSAPLTLNERSFICRTCLKVLESNGFTYIDSDSGYVKNVGKIREMLQFCIPELDLYVSTKPVICHQCLPLLVQIYNFKIKCLNGENTIRDYINRNNLQQYNQVNLNCVLMDDLKIKSQNIQIENRIKQFMKQEGDKIGIITDISLTKKSEQPPQSSQVVVPHSENESQGELLNYSEDQDCPDLINDEETLERQMKIEIEESEEPIEDNCDVKTEAETARQDINELVYEESNEITEEVIPEPPITVAVRKDLFQLEQEPVEQPAPAIVLNNGFIPKNGKIIIKIDKTRLQNITALKNSDSLNASSIISPVVAPQNITLVTPNNTTVVASPIITVSTPDTKAETSACATSVAKNTDSPTITSKTVYNCNKCKFKTEDVIEIYDHNRLFHDFDYTCQHCPFSTSKVELLGKHMTMVHPQTMISNRSQSFKVTENFACSLCPFSVKNLDLLKSHQATAHGNEDESPLILNNVFGNDDRSDGEPKVLKRLEYTCDVCPYSTRDKSNLRKHLFTHGTKPLKCDFCMYKCVSPYQLRRHQKQKHAKKLKLKPRAQPYILPVLDKKEDANDSKITLDSMKMELQDVS